MITTVPKSCDTCPHNSGWDPMDCMQNGRALIETCFCSFGKKDGEEHRQIGCMNRNKMHSKVPIPKWCPAGFYKKKGWFK